MTSMSADKVREVLSILGYEEDKIQQVLNVLYDEKQSVDEPKKADIRCTLKQLGVPANLRGYEYILYAMELISKDKEMHSITKVLYPAIAQKYKTKPSRVERAIRYAVQKAWTHGDTVLQNDMFKYTRKSPTNSIFIITLAEYIGISD